MSQQAIKFFPIGYDQIVFRTHFPNHAPDHLFRYWVEPPLLTQWWPTEAEVSPQLNGAYCMSWPQMNWHLRGVYTTFEPGQYLGFSWQWDHEPDRPERHVTVRFEAHPDGGTTLTLAHGGYSASEIDQEERQSHIDGWLHFLSQLQQQ